MKILLVATWLALAACAGPPYRGGTTPRPVQCGSDLDCTGDRVCWSGQCADPATIQRSPW